MILQFFLQLVPTNKQRTGIQSYKSYKGMMSYTTLLGSFLHVCVSMLKAYRSPLNSISCEWRKET